MDRADVSKLQKALNGFVYGWPKLGLSKVIVDGQMGPATEKLFHDVRYLIGYQHLIMNPDEDFYKRIVHPQKFEPSWGQDERVIKDGYERRRLRRNAVLKNKIRAYLKPGVGKFDGVPIARCLIPPLTWCRKNGWNGHVNSGWRSPAYSEHLCFEMCGAPSCPGRCAGKDSNHSGDSPEKCAVDVSDYDKFREVIARCPIPPHIHNDLPSDLVHFSPSGH
jgi:hypothetical protein